MCGCGGNTFEILTVKDFAFRDCLFKVKTCETVADLNAKIWITGLNASLGGGLVKCIM